MYTKQLVSLLLVMSLLSASVAYAQHKPIHVSADLPITIGMGLPRAYSASHISQGSVKTVINLDVKSNGNKENTGGEQLVLFGETKTVDLNLAYALTKNWQIDGQISYIKHSGGGLDSYIRDWHELFGLPEGDRPLFNVGAFEMSYLNAGIINIAKPANGFGDTRIGSSYIVSKKENSQAALKLGINLPTGSKEKLTGSEKTDFDFGVYSAGAFQRGIKNTSWHANLGLVYVGDESSLGIPTKRTVGFNSLGLGWKPSPNIMYKAQLDSHTALFKSNIKEIASPASQLSLSVEYESANLGDWELYFSEDLRVDRSADFAIGLTARFSF